jgi:hypothetical protein
MEPTPDRENVTDIIKTSSPSAAGPRGVPGGDYGVLRERGGAVQHHLLQQDGGDVPQARAAGPQGLGQVRGRAHPRTGEHIRKIIRLSHKSNDHHIREPHFCNKDHITKSAAFFNKTVEMFHKPVPLDVKASAKSAGGLILVLVSSQGRSLGDHTSVMIITYKATFL